MLNTALEKNHEEMLEFHFKHEIMEAQLVKNKHQIISPQALMAKIKLIMSCDNPDYNIKLGDSPTNDALSFQRQHNYESMDRMTSAAMRSVATRSASVPDVQTHRYGPNPKSKHNGPMMSST